VRQANHERELIDWVQEQAARAGSLVVLNGAGLDAYLGGAAGRLRAESPAMRWLAEHARPAAEVPPRPG